MRSAFLFIVGLCLRTVFLLAAVGCSKHQIAPLPAPDSLSRRFLALGDSYTIGESVDSRDRFPAQTTTLLKTMGIQVGPPQYIAQTGWTSSDLQYAISRSDLLPGYDIVSLLIGVNDQYRGLDTAGYRKRFTQLLQTAIQLAGNKTTHVFVLSIPDYGVTPFGGGLAKISKEIDGFNAINRQVTTANHIAYIDITPTSRLAANDQSLTANDGLHPSAKQYGLWAQQLAIPVQSVLK
jgi:lysophospholipase L1-like esterase